ILKGARAVRTLRLTPGTSALLGFRIECQCWRVFMDAARGVLRHACGVDQVGGKLLDDSAAGVWARDEQDQAMEKDPQRYHLALLYYQRTSFSYIARNLD